MPCPLEFRDWNDLQGAGRLVEQGFQPFHSVRFALRQGREFERDQVGAACWLPKEFTKLFTHRFSNQRRNSISDETELMGAGDRKLKPIREALDAGGLPRCQGPVLGGVNEHQAVLGQMRHDGGAELIPVLSLVAILEAGAVIGELEGFAASFGLPPVLTFFDARKVAQISGIMRARLMRCQLCGLGYLKDALQIMTRRCTSLGKEFLPLGQIVSPCFLTGSSRKLGQITDGIP